MSQVLLEPRSTAPGAEPTNPLSGSRSGPEFRRDPTLTLIGCKVLMALTGVGLLGFVSFHMLGNLQIFLGQEKLNAYAAFLKGMPVLLWIARIGLLVIFVSHIVLAIYIKRINRAARPVRYVFEDTVQATLASRTMMLSGLTILAFVIYHLLHFTLGITNPDHHVLIDAQGRHDVYSMVVLGFQNIFISATYIVAIAFLGLHLSHATSSIFQTLGLGGPLRRRLIHRAGLGIAAAIVVGNCSVPLAVLFGFVTLPSGVSR